MPRLSKKLPSYRLHKSTNQAVVTLDGKDHYLGPHGTPGSRDAYDKAVAEWLARGRARVPVAEAKPSTGATVSECILAFWNHAKAHYTDPDGRPGSSTTSGTRCGRSGSSTARPRPGSSARSR